MCDEYATDELGTFYIGPGAYATIWDRRIAALERFVAARRELREIDRDADRLLAARDRRKTRRGDMNDDERFALVGRMRAAQLRYFRTRDSGALEDSKRLEREVDQMLKDRREGAGLFDGDGRHRATEDTTEG